MVTLARNRLNQGGADAVFEKLLLPDNGSRDVVDIDAHADDPTPGLEMFDKGEFGELCFGDAATRHGFGPQVGHEALACLGRGPDHGGEEIHLPVGLVGCCLKPFLDQGGAVVLGVV